MDQIGGRNMVEPLSRFAVVWISLEQPGKSRDPQ
jgi:hypothetical protein